MTVLTNRLTTETSRSIDAIPAHLLLWQKGYSYSAPPRRRSTIQGIEHTVREQKILAAYVDGWSEADPAKIALVTTESYDFHDPLVGHFSKWDLSEYFAGAFWGDGKATTYKPGVHPWRPDARRLQRGSPPPILA